MKEIIEVLQDLKINIDYDIKNTWSTKEEKNNFLRQSTQMAMAIGLLENLGENFNFDSK